jgi:hypothetical protein
VQEPAELVAELGQGAIVRGRNLVVQSDRLQTISYHDLSVDWRAAARQSVEWYACLQAARCDRQM